MDSHNIAHEEFDENERLSEFYRSIPASVKNFKICYVPKRIIRDIVVILDSTFYFDDQWEEFVEDLGIHNHMTIRSIKANAKARKELPLYVALTGPLKQNGSLGQVIEVLLQNERLDVLLHIKPFIEELIDTSSRKKVGLSNSGQSTSLHRQESELMHFKIDEKNQTCFNVCADKKLPNIEGLIASEALQDKGTFIQNYRKFLCDSKAPEYKNETRGRTDIDYIACTCAALGLKDSRQKAVPYTLSEKNLDISVFIVNADADYQIAQKLSQILQKHYGMQVTILSDMEHLLSVDNSGVLNAKLIQTNFTVPIVSESLLRIIHAHRNFDEQEDEACNVRYVFQWEQTQYFNASCLNFRVRPVMVPEIERRRVKQEVLFCSALRLWGEVPKFVRILQSSLIRRL